MMRDPETGLMISAAQYYAKKPTEVTEQDSWWNKIERQIAELELAKARKEAGLPGGSGGFKAGQIAGY